MFRILLDMLLVFLIFLVPWWIPLLIAVGLLFKFEAYFEIIFLGLVVDALYATPEPFWSGWELVITTFAALIFIAVAYLKKRLKFYAV